MNTEDQLLELIRAVVTRARNSEDFEEVMVRIREEINLIKADERKRLKPLVLEAVMVGTLQDLERRLAAVFDPSSSNPIPTIPVVPKREDKESP